jgi:8-oxo-dGTP diphosphatase
MAREEAYNKHKNPVPAVDFIIINDGDDDNNNNSKILLVTRKNDPFKGMLSIPGGFINAGETAEVAMRREAKEETSLVLEPIAILGVYSDPRRDPRMHTLSVTFITRIVQGNEDASEDAAALKWVEIEHELDSLIESKRIAFDHSKILDDFKKWLKSSRTSIDSSNCLTFWSTKTEQIGEAMQVKATE